MTADARLRLWDIASGEGLSLPSGADVSVLALDLHSGAPQFVNAGSDDVVRVWSAERPAALIELQHEGAPVDTAFARDGRMLATAGPDERARLWDTEAGLALATFQHDATVVRSSTPRVAGRAKSF